MEHWRNADTIVTHPAVYLAIFELGSDFDAWLLLVAHELYRIIDKVLKHLYQPARVSTNLWHIICNLQVYAPCFYLYRHPLDGFMHQQTQISNLRGIHLQANPAQFE